MLDKIRNWSYHKQGLGQAHADIGTALSAVAGVYSSHPSAALSLRARVSGFTAEDFIEMEAKRKAFRTPAMRQSVYLLPADTAARFRSACLPPADDPSWAKRYSQSGRKIPPEHYDAWTQQLLARLQSPQALTLLKGQTEIPDEKLKFVLNRMAFEGKVLRVGGENLRANKLRYVDAASWSEGRFQLGEASAHRGWLAGAYLQAFGPAREADFRWWAGLNVSQAREALQQQATVTLADDFLLLESEAEAFEAFEGSPAGRLDLLPQWDSYLMGYAPDGRKRFVQDEYLEQLYGKLGATGGNALASILWEGEVVGLWKARFAGKKMRVATDFFRTLPPEGSQQLSSQLDEIAQLLDAGKWEWETK